MEVPILRPAHLDHATYVGPIEVRETKSKGRGLFATRAIKTGHLLLCEKAFAHAHIDNETLEGKPANAKLTVLANPETDKMVIGGHADLLRMIAQKLYRSPSLGPKFTALYHGDYESVPTIPEKEPVVDT